MSDISEESREEQNPEELQGEDSTIEESEEDGEEEKAKPLHLHTRTVPTIVMLFGGGAAAIFTFIRHDSLLTSLEIIFVALVIFLVLGDIIKLFLDSITIEVPEERNSDGDKVIERPKEEDMEETSNEASQGGEATEQVET